MALELSRAPYRFRRLPPWATEWAHYNRHREDAWEPPATARHTAPWYASWAPSVATERQTPEQWKASWNDRDWPNPPFFQWYERSWFSDPEWETKIFGPPPPLPPTRISAPSEWGRKYAWPNYTPWHSYEHASPSHQQPPNPYPTYNQEPPASPAQWYNQQPRQYSEPTPEQPPTYSQYQQTPQFQPPTYNSNPSPQYNAYQKPSVREPRNYPTPGSETHRAGPALHPTFIFPYAIRLCMRDRQSPFYKDRLEIYYENGSVALVATGTRSDDTQFLNLADSRGVHMAQVERRANPRSSTYTIREASGRTFATVSVTRSNLNRSHDVFIAGADGQRLYRFSGDFYQNDFKIFDAQSRTVAQLHRSIYSPDSQNFSLLVSANADSLMVAVMALIADAIWDA
eukprot:TRINITY_DN12686_c0_g1_i1.p1 TRINITY_DN12686_c0_g1~~TRINITY_DN12686_c0_g1_i1.p1  ORF type:complete len:407 (-),score=37.59 TRINITY_DN12686_c0_g1_i1:32-1228(-)